MKYLFLTAYLFLSTLSLFSQDMDDVEIRVENVSENIYVLYGQGGNIGVLTGSEGVILIDDQFAQLTNKIIDAVKSISPDQIRFVINTHYHGDHVGGNENLAKMGATIIAHTNVLTRLAESEDGKKEALPVITFEESINLHLNGQTISVIHGGNAHTDGDVAIYFRDANVIHAGDLFVTYGYPFIDINAGGSFVGMIDLSEKILSQINDETKVIPGHGPISSKQDIVEFQSRLIEIKDIIEKGIKNGKSAEDLINENALSKFDDEWGGGFFKAKDLILIAYPELAK